MLRLCESISPYGLYTSERVEHPINVGLAERHDVMAHYLRYGNRLGVGGPVKEMARRTNYFRGELAYGQRRHPEAGRVLDHPALLAAARNTHGLPLVVPNIVFANVVVPGQELAPHTDVPEFLGCNRKTMPQWLVVVMLRSGLFEPWRIKIATGVTWLTQGVGGAFVCWPNDVDGPAHEVSADANTAFMVDNCSVVHAVDRFGPPDTELPPLKPGMKLNLSIDGESVVTDTDGCEVVRYSIEDLRVALVWKAYCFADAAEQRRWERAEDHLPIEFVIERIVDDLRNRGRLHGEVEIGPELGRLMIDEYVRYPIPVDVAGVPSAEAMDSRASTRLVSGRAVA